jgi:hypothetical protein
VENHTSIDDLMIDVFLNKTLHLRAISRCHVSVLQAIPEKKYVLKKYYCIFDV